ncbi:DsrE/DsrF/DrsH-like family protein [Wansuia hejianensis]|uniref:DsrE/DsrF/DrsH-like family protein n=1 Tax=Wansuia hejianensis TaxID=2763667 RepID=A0A926ILT4_9FIRM|nr:DsrE/DsrF/DrsH-like family protein [Wansuia hejianensis]MBC8589710.1 DsrE/DsrF/DrsH-like family protein [Wansuia hejianensis]
MNKKMSILMFSGDYDKALAALILANTAREIDVDVTIFFAFWGLMLIRDSNKLSDEDKTAAEKMFANMTPKHIEDLPLSKMNFAGIGKKMLVGMMEDSDTPPLSAFMKGALNKGVNMKACKLSCEVMGFSEEELLDEVTVVTAEDYLRDALESNIQLFI